MSRFSVFCFTSPVFKGLKERTPNACSASSGNHQHIIFWELHTCEVSCKQFVWEMMLCFPHLFICNVYWGVTYPDEDFSPGWVDSKSARFWPGALGEVAAFGPKVWWIQGRRGRQPPGTMGQAWYISYIFIVHSKKLQYGGGFLIWKVDILGLLDAKRS